jgi:uracil-DNA glycosylase
MQGQVEAFYPRTRLRSTECCLQATGTSAGRNGLSGMDAISPIRSLAALRAAEAECTRCPLYRFATQVVPGAGAAHARIMLVGEQPGDKEDLAGKPFVGPAGAILDKALSEAGAPRKQLFVTNAVKHFKFEQRGKKRLHKRPNAYEIERCKWWNDIERKLVKPDLVVALGATAARSLFGKVVTITNMRGKVTTLPDGGRALVTIHPSALLRMPDEASRRREFKRFVDDLAVCSDFLKQRKAA